MDLAQEPLHDIAQKMNMKSIDDMFAAVGAGDMRVGQIVNAVLRQTDAGQSQQELPLIRKALEATVKPGKDDIYIEGVGNLLTQMA
ncbi:DUF5913 domain-containing protein, partial [Wenyingzhuangia sp. 1_MG-2023]|nr:DUF5913 domain-containing protein [Wenyingzhuangia sp. 1_MG-2023]